MTAPEPLPSSQHGRDRWLALALLGFAATSFGVDRLAALDVDFCTEQSMWGALCWYGRNLDPLFLANPQWLRVMSGISAFVFGPAYLVLAWGIWRGVEAARWPTIAWAVALLYSMVVHLWMEFFGDYPPPRPGLLLAIYLPYAVVPILALWRFSRPPPSPSPDRAR
ncbi:EXPERA domain-containing protein [Enhygromyxa salina]|uniref:EXPERA domain-containing protein n=1 Tax=Enhygromyxa salina TaxID=215803 RepID=A0A2S9YMY1_9BACT|nr:emopamil-binding family protein [Enhygromyxa salina]PRQ06447.1 hypothetical protein ENSA7_37660 [Enhygromyxa salina]